MHFKNVCKGDVIIPTGRLEEISKLRKTLSPCLIALDWEDVGKYASWTTSFKILDESPLKTRVTGRRDVYDPIDVATWLCERNYAVRQIVEFISDKLAIGPRPIRLETLISLLEEIRKSIETTRSYSEWFHPRKIIEALTVALQWLDSASSSQATVGNFLRKIGMEPFSKFDNVPIFGDQAISEGSFPKYLQEYQNILENYLTSSYEKGSNRLRKTLSTMVLNLLRRLLVVVAEKELNNGEKGKWTEYLVEFEQGRREKRTRRRKYDVNIYGVTILGRSSVSLLPSRIRFVLERSKDFDGQNILLSFFKNELKALLVECNKIWGSIHFELTPIEMVSTDALTVELLLEKQGLLVADPYKDGLEAPTREVNDLLSKLGVE